MNDGPTKWKCYADFIRVRVRERLSATPGHVIGQGPAPGGRVVPRGGGGGESDFPSRKLTCWSIVDFPSMILTCWVIFSKICEKFTNKTLFKKDKDGMLIRNNNDDLEKINYDNMT